MGCGASSRWVRSGANLRPGPRASQRGVVASHARRRACAHWTAVVPSPIFARLSTVPLEPTMTSTQTTAPFAYSPPATHVLEPVAPAERIAGLDVLRGWAMFGVLWSNLNDWYWPPKPTTRA